MHSDRKGSAVDDFDGNLLLKLRIGALGKVNLAHPARAQGAQYPVRTYAISHHSQSMHPDTYRLQTTAALAAEHC
jgi:hypothetical protein